MTQDEVMYVRGYPPFDWLPDDPVLLDLDHRMVCTACGGADVRPDWTPMTGSAGMGGAHSLS
jgi:hypothetical protein